MRQAVQAMEGRWLERPLAAAEEEAELILGCQRGEEAAFRVLMGRYRGPALHLAGQILRDRTEAEDVVQEAFLRVFRSIRRFRGQSSFYSWLYRIVVNLCMDRRRRVSFQATVPLDEAWDADGSGPWRDTRLLVDTLLARLGEELRVTLILREVVGLSYAEIAGELGIPIGTVRSRLSAAREQFRQLWTRAVSGEEEP